MLDCTGGDSQHSAAAIAVGELFPILKMRV